MQVQPDPPRLTVLVNVTFIVAFMLHLTTLRRDRYAAGGKTGGKQSRGSASIDVCAMRHSQRVLPGASAGRRPGCLRPLHELDLED